MIARTRHTARQVKHLGFVAHKSTRGRLRRAKFAVATKVFRHAESARPYAYDARRYRGSFLDHTEKPTARSEFPRRVFVIWAGDNELSENRRRNLERIRSTIGLPVELVTPDTIDRWLVDGHPLHPAYDHLSYVHRSDYLRGYLMHHHGGAYVDIKAPLESWRGPFDAMDADPDAWVTSYSATHADWTAGVRGRLGRDILVRYRLAFGKSGFMMRSHTPLTAEWMAEMHRRLDRVQGDVARHPGGVYGSKGYPVAWTELLGMVLDPLTLKYGTHVRYDERMLLDFSDYR